MYIPSQLRQAADSTARSGHTRSIDEGLKRLASDLTTGEKQQQQQQQWHPLKRQFSDNASKNADIRTGIIVGVVLGVALVAFVAFLWIYRVSIQRMSNRKKKRHRPRSGSSSKSSKSSKSSDGGGPPPPPPPPPADG